jgi:hypothetical protein
VAKTPTTPSTTPAAPAATAASAAERVIAAVNAKDSEKIEALRNAAEYGEDIGVAGIRAVCELTTRTGQAVRIAALRALEKVAPALHRPFETLVMDDDPVRHIEAARQIGNMNAGGAPAVPVLLMHINTPHPAKRGVTATRNTVWSADAALGTLKADFRALVRVAPEDPQVLKLLLRFATTPQLRVSLPGPRPRDPDTVFTVDARPPAVSALGGIAVRNPSTRPEVIPFLMGLLRTVDREPFLAAVAMQAMAECGRDAIGEEGIEAITRLTRHPEPEIREIAFESLKTLGKSALSTAAPSRTRSSATVRVSW